MIEAAGTSVGVREGIRAAENDLMFLLENYMYIQQYEQIMGLVKQLAKQIPGLEGMVKIKGVGLITAAGSIAEVGDINGLNIPGKFRSFLV